MAIEQELRRFVKAPKLPPVEERIRLAKKCLKIWGEPVDFLRVFIAVKSLEDIRGNK